MGPGLELIRPGIDVIIYQKNGVDWVQMATGGASTRSVAYRLRRAGRWWRIPAGTNYPDALVVYNDHGNHWVWEPAHDMPLFDYVAALAGMNGTFV